MPVGESAALARSERGFHHVPRRTGDDRVLWSPAAVMRLFRAKPRPDLSCGARALMLTTVKALTLQQNASNDVTTTYSSRNFNAEGGGGLAESEVPDDLAR